MTPRELAEKILCWVHCVQPAGRGIDRDLESLISEAMKEAKESVNMECLKCRRACSYYCRECYFGEVSSAYTRAAEVARGFKCRCMCRSNEKIEEVAAAIEKLKGEK